MPAGDLPVFRAFGGIEVLDSAPFSIHAIESILDHKSVAKELSGSPSLVCPPAPQHLHGGSSFYCVESDFDTIRRKLSATLDTMQNFAYYFDESTCSWRSKVVCGSQSMEIYINCYWDAVANDHMVVMKKMFGACCVPFCADLYCKITSTFTIYRQTSMSPFPLPLLPTVAISKDMLLRGLQRIQFVAASPFVEAKLEASRMLCDSLSKTSAFWCDEDVLHMIIESIKSLVQSEDHEIVQCTFEAIGLMLAAGGSLAVSKLAQETTVLQVCLGHISNSTSVSLAYQTVHMKRKAAAISVVICTYFPNIIYDCLTANGVSNRNYWLMYTSTLTDETMRTTSAQLVHCFPI